MFARSFENGYTGIKPYRSMPATAEIRIMSDSIEIVNPLRKRDRSSGNGIGLRLVSEQYRMYGKNVTINETGESFSVRIPYLQ